MHQLFMVLKKAYDKISWEVLYNIVIFWYPHKLVWLIKMYVNETYSKVRVGKNLSDIFLIMNVL